MIATAMNTRDRCSGVSPGQATPSGNRVKEQDNEVEAQFDSIPRHQKD